MAEAITKFMVLIQQQPRYGIHYFDAKVGADFNAPFPGKSSG